MKEEVDVLGSPKLVVRTVSVDAKQHLKKKKKNAVEVYASGTKPIVSNKAVNTDKWDHIQTLHRHRQVLGACSNIYSLSCTVSSQCWVNCLTATYNYTL